MRSFGAIGAALLIACAMSSTPSRADGPAPTPAVSRSAAPGCKCPQVKQRRVVRVHRHVRRHRHVAFLPPPAVIAPVYYNTGIPSPYDSAYDRAMVLHFRSPPVSGLYQPEMGWPPTPPVRGIQPYRVQAGGPLLQYDGMIGEYVRLAHDDPAQAVMVVAHPVHH